MKELEKHQTPLERINNLKIKGNVPLADRSSQRESISSERKARESGDGRRDSSRSRDSINRRSTKYKL